MRLLPAMENLIEAFSKSEPYLFESLTERDYNRFARILDDLIDIVGEDENHILATVMDLI